MKKIISSTIKKGCMIQLFTLLSFRSAIANDEYKLQDAILQDIMPPSSTRCIDSFETDSINGGSAAFSFNFRSTNKESGWDTTNADHEQKLFLLEMNHTTPDNNENRTWSLRIGKGGNIYSFVGPFGEAIPPQTSDSK
eukprot:CAMPEP_0194430460 /NCGR_PEP_ID=MMETSP0176-20130528/55548_1 /TAXON_ID=216777 /ORGANISM="Proboscia alata, Strain PI-D3" /LENGTH=137 /DNA_ID=CAMNT_0039244733 /DNA_START=132 /DNA_END=542 /DNA_ORIENTATION=+